MDANWLLRVDRANDVERALAFRSRSDRATLVEEHIVDVTQLDDNKLTWETRHVLGTICGTRSPDHEPIRR